MFILAHFVIVLLNVDQIEPIVWNKKAFDRLVLEKKSKELVTALVTVHVSTNKIGDIISGKGNGLIILLHGSPGVGKTLTAGKCPYIPSPISIQRRADNSLQKGEKRKILT